MSCMTDKYDTGRKLFYPFEASNSSHPLIKTHNAF